jgi:hypothetical protein
MKLVHYSRVPLPPLRRVEQHPHTFKPEGLWVSDDDERQNWASIVPKARGGLRRNLKYAYDVTLAAAANVLMLRGVDEVDEFIRRWTVVEPRAGRFPWSRVAEQYDGVIISPYVRSYPIDREISERDRQPWYFAWDCASGCIWNPADAILRITWRGGYRSPPSFKCPACKRRSYDPAEVRLQACAVCTLVDAVKSGSRPPLWSELFQAAR